MSSQKVMLFLMVMLLVTACVSLDRVTTAEAPFEPDETSDQAGEVVVQEENNLTIQTDKSQQTLVCNNQDIMIRGSDNMITLPGTCDTLEVLGNDNTIRVEQVATIRVDGNDNMVTWQEGVDADTPAVTNTGTDNRIRQDGRQASTEVVEESSEESSVNDLFGGDTGSVSTQFGDLDTLIGQVGNPEAMIIVAGTGDVGTYACENNSVVVTGTENIVILEGTCEAIIVASADNDILWRKLYQLPLLVPRTPLPGKIVLMANHPLSPMQAQTT
ncbi:MAG: hypothetical protein GFH27_549289n365 [Chloroflexi bacterium AL-W]|nr:hypothetical protein [Chloroflexi bacterium AL-N10]NOK81699.1 hypothetical protein [Chloroflexi bacterium AL-W]